MPNPLVRAADAVAPPRLGRSFRLLLLTSVVTNTGDGIALAAGPLLVASQTRDPLIVSMAVLAQNLPVLLFGFAAGVVADRVDRVRLMAVVNVVRGIVLALLAASVATHVVSIWVVLAALFALGTAETFADIGSASILPRLVRREDLGIANARITGSVLLTNQLVAPPIGAFMFAAGMALPFIADAAGFLLGAVLVSRVVYSVVVDAPAVVERRHWRHEMAEGLRWLWDHPPMRTLVDHDPRVQRHVRRRLVRARPVCAGAAGHDRGRLRPDHDRDGDRRDRRHGVVRRGSSGGSRSPTSCASAW